MARPRWSARGADVGKTTDRAGMREMLDDLRIGRDPAIGGADFILPRSEFHGPRSWRLHEQTWADFGVLPGDHVQWREDSHSDTVAVRVALRPEPATFVDLMRA